MKQGSNMIIDILYVGCLLLSLVFAIKLYDVIYCKIKDNFAKANCSGYEERFIEVVIWLISSIFPLLCVAILAIPLAVGVWDVLGIILVFISYGHLIIYVGLWVRIIANEKKQKSIIRYGIPWALNATYMVYIMNYGVKHDGILYQLWRFIFFPLSGTYRDEMIDIEPMWRMIYLIISAAMVFACIFNIKKQKQ